MNIYEIKPEDFVGQECQITLSKLKVDDRFSLPYIRCSGKVVSIRGRLLTIDISHIDNFDITRYDGCNMRRAFTLEDIIDIEIIEKTNEVLPQ